jgi:hypothetical protein
VAIHLRQVGKTFLSGSVQLFRLRIVYITSSQKSARKLKIKKFKKSCLS